MTLLQGDLAFVQYLNCAPLTVFEGELLGRVLVQHQGVDLLLQILLTVPPVLTAIDENIELPEKSKGSGTNRGRGEIVAWEGDFATHSQESFTEEPRPEMDFLFKLAIETYRI